MCVNGFPIRMGATTTPTAQRQIPPVPSPDNAAEIRSVGAAEGAADREANLDNADPTDAEGLVDEADEVDAAAVAVLAATNFPSSAAAHGIIRQTSCAYPLGTATTDRRCASATSASALFVSLRLSKHREVPYARR